MEGGTTLRPERRNGTDGSMPLLLLLLPLEVPNVDFRFLLLIGFCVVDASEDPAL